MTMCSIPGLHMMPLKLSAGIRARAREVEAAAEELLQLWEPNVRLDGAIWSAMAVPVFTGLLVG